MDGSCLFTRESIGGKCKVFDQRCADISWVDVSKDVHPERSLTNKRKVLAQIQLEFTGVPSRNVGDSRTVASSLRSS